MIQKPTSIQSQREQLLALIDQASDQDDIDYITAALKTLESQIPRPPKKRRRRRQSKSERGARMQAASAEAKRKATRSHQDIGAPPIGLEDATRKKRSHISLRYFLTHHFRNLFFRGFAPDHKRIIRLIQKIIDHGGQKAIALMRKAGKSTILLCSVLWAVLTGRRRFVCLISASTKTARKLLGKIKKFLRTNVTLQADYAASLHCLVSLGGRTNAAAGQHVDGKKTGVQWSAEFISSGYIEGHHEKEWCISSLSIISEDIRGQSFITQRGEALRVDQVLVDDPQSRATAKSKSKTKRRLEIINGDVLECGGERQVAAMAAVTVIENNDVADTLVDRAKSKAWTGEKIPCIKKYPGEGGMTLWNEWQEIFEDELDLDDVKHSRSRQFVIDYFEEMHAGAVVFWDDDYDRDSEVSALHGAMIKRAKDRKSFEAEKQLNPLSDSSSSDELFDLNADEIATRTTTAKRREVPEGVEVITSFVDLQNDFLPYAVVGWAISGRGYVLDYGTMPDMGTPYFLKTELPTTLSEFYGGLGKSDAIAQGLEDLIGALMSAEFVGGDTVFSIDKLGIDVGYKIYAEQVRRFCRESEHRSRIHPQQGKFIGAKTQNWQRFKQTRRQKGIDCAFLDPPKKQRGVKELNVDVNAWKSRMAEALTVPINSMSAVVLFDAPSEHLMFGEHCADAESPHLVSGKDGSTHIEWRPESTGLVENDYWDCLVGCAAIASTLGVFERTAKAKSTIDLSKFAQRLAALKK
ncbi:MAG: terminase gpA endonuclease subunit [Planctomycetota bacterium]